MIKIIVICSSTLNLQSLVCACVKCVCVCVQLYLLATRAETA